MTTRRKNKPGQGRKPLGQDRGGLVMISANIFSDQAEKLRSMDERGMAQAFIRLALDDEFKRLENAAKRVAAKNKDLGICGKCGRPLHKFHDCELNPVANPDES